MTISGFKSLLKKTTKKKKPSIKSPMEQLAVVFDKFDANGDGKISASELKSILSNLGQVLSDEEIDAMINEVDSDGDGFIDLNEFIELNTKGIDSDEIMVNLREAFSVYDIDGDGSISAYEIMEILRSLGDECTIKDCKRMISGVDSDGDGAISFEEFKVMMMMGVRFNGVN